MEAKSKLMPSLHNDNEAEKFVAEADLSKYNLSGFKPMRFEEADVSDDLETE